jgi:hypothetical protein
MPQPLWHRTLPVTILVLGFIRHCVALPWEMKTGSLPPLGGCGQAEAGVFALFCRRRASWKVHCCWCAVRRHRERLDRLWPRLRLVLEPLAG